MEDGGAFFTEVQKPPAPEWLELVEHISQLPDVLRANLYSRRRTIVWSSDPGLIGSEFKDNPELERALHGEIVAHGGEGEKREHDKLVARYPYFVEIYSPVWDHSLMRGMQRTVEVRSQVRSGDPTRPDGAQLLRGDSA